MRRVDPKLDRSGAETKVLSEEKAKDWLREHPDMIDRNDGIDRRNKLVQFMDKSFEKFREYIRGESERESKGKNLRYEY